MQPLHANGAQRVRMSPWVLDGVVREQRRRAQRSAAELIWAVVEPALWGALFVVAMTMTAVLWVIEDKGER